MTGSTDSLAVVGKQRRYSPQERERAVQIAAEDGLNAAARAIGCSRQSAEKWCHKMGIDPAVKAREAAEGMAARHAKNREDTMRLSGEVARACFAHALELIPQLEADQFRDLMVSAGIATDKGELLGGRATDRTETYDLSSELDKALEEMLAGDEDKEPS